MRDSLRLLGHPKLLFWALTGLLGGCFRDPRPLPEVPDAPPSATATESSGAGSATEGDWSYLGDLGPESWARLKPEWKGCGESGQSPIDLPLDALTNPPAAKDTEAPELAFLRKGPLIPQLAALPLEATNDGRRLVLAGAPTQGVTVAGTLAALEAIDLHLPAEHKLGGTAVDLELVFWLKHPQAGRIGLSLLFRTGAANETLTPLISRLPASGRYERELLGGTLALPALFPAEDKLLAYVGSETTPPCTSPIPRLVVARVAELSREQLDALRKALPSTSQRPTQPQGTRTVALFSLAAAPAPTASSQAAKENQP